MADSDEITLSPHTHAALQGLTRARHELLAWEHNLRQALADDVTSGRLTVDQAEGVAEDAELKDFKAPKPDQPDAVETTAEGNQAQLDAQTKVADAAAAKAAPAANHRTAAEKERHEVSERERHEQHERDEKAKAAPPKAR